MKYKGKKDMNPILKYPGAKWRLADWIIDRMPDHIGYVEPFFGSGAVFFNKPKSPIETISDLDGSIMLIPEWLCSLDMIVIYIEIC